MLRFPRALWIALAIAVLATSPALSAPLTFDDQFQALRIAGQVPGPSQDPFNVYSFGPGKIEPNGLGWDGCVYPWWSDAGHAARFFRPLSSAILYAEHRAFGRSPVPFHLVSLLVFLGALVLVSKLFRRLLPEREAALATFAFAVAPCHLQVACWAAAIHLSVTAIFVLSALLLYLDAREQRAASLTKHAGALLLGAMALSCGESALGLFAFLFAYETFGRTEAWSSTNSVATASRSRRPTSIRSRRRSRTRASYRSGFSFCRRARCSARRSRWPRSSRPTSRSTTPLQALSPSSPSCRSFSSRVAVSTSPHGATSGGSSSARSSRRYQRPRAFRAIEWCSSRASPRLRGRG